MILNVVVTYLERPKNTHRVRSLGKARWSRLEPLPSASSNASRYPKGGLSQSADTRDGAATIHLRPLRLHAELVLSKASCRVEGASQASNTNEEAAAEVEFEVWWIRVLPALSIFSADASLMRHVLSALATVLCIGLLPLQHVLLRSRGLSLFTTDNHTLTGAIPRSHSRTDFEPQCREQLVTREHRCCDLMPPSHAIELLSLGLLVVGAPDARRR